MRVIDSHFHWYPRTVLEHLISSGLNRRHFGARWYDLAGLLADWEATGHEAEVIGSAGLASEFFSDVAVDAGRDGAMRYNEAMAEAQSEFAGRFRGSVAVPLRQTDVAIAVLDHAVQELGLRTGVAVPGRVGPGEAPDVARLEDFYARVEELGVPILLHPTDATFQDMFGGYDAAFHQSLGRVIDLSVTAFRLILSGIMERHPRLQVVMSHTGGALPYQAARLDKNATIDSLPHPPSVYLKRIHVDTVNPSPESVRFAIEYFGIDHVLLGTDNPCWSPGAALAVIDALQLDEADRESLMFGNAERVFGI